MFQQASGILSRMLSPQDLEICSVAQAPELETALRQLEQGPWLHRLQHRVVARIPVGWVKMETPLPDDSSWYHPGEGVAPSGAVAEGRRSSCYWQRKLLQEVCWGRRLDANVKVASLICAIPPATAPFFRFSPASGWVSSAPPAAGSQPRQRLGLCCTYPHQGPGARRSSSGPWCGAGLRASRNQDWDDDAGEARHEGTVACATADAVSLREMDGAGGASEVTSSLRVP